MTRLTSTQIENMLLIAKELIRNRGSCIEAERTLKIEISLRCNRFICPIQFVRKLTDTPYETCTSSKAIAYATQFILNFGSPEELLEL